MKLIPLTQGGGYTIVDDEDYEFLNQWKWHQVSGYVKRNITLSNKKDQLKKQATIYMHRSITACPHDLCVDHINHDTLDNRKSNLRICTRTQNQANRSKSKVGKTSKYKGISWGFKNNRWRASIGFNNKIYSLGWFHDQEDAVIMYNVAAQLFFGEYSKLNNI